MSGPAPFIFDKLLGLLRGRQVADVPCPQCSQLRKAINRGKPVLRLWRVEERLISYHCVHCETSGYVWEGGEPGRIDPIKLAEAERQSDALKAEAIASGRKKARAIYARRQPIAGTLGEIYLREYRKVSCNLPETMGFLPGYGRYPPAIVTPFGFVREISPGVLEIPLDEGVMGLHLTRLTSDGNKLSEKPKIMLGQGAKGFPLVVAPPNDLLGLVITEGIEDALSVHQATGLGAWAAGSKDRLAALADAVPDWMDCVTVRPDDEDGGGRKRALELVQAIRSRMVPGPGGELRPMHAEINKEIGR